MFPKYIKKIISFLFFSKAENLSLVYIVTVPCQLKMINSENLLNSVEDHSFVSRMENQFFTVLLLGATGVVVLGLLVSMQRFRV